VRSDGSIIDSSVIISCEFTEEVNSTTNLTVGDATASELTVEILNTANIQQDEKLTYYIVEDDVEKKIGVFNVEKPTVATRTSMKFSAYDNIVKTEKIFSGWLRENQSLFPMTLLALVQYACSECGVTLATTSFPNSDLSVNALYADDISCRQVLMWAASIAGRFIRANADGKLEFAWYGSTTTVTVRPSKSTSSNQIPYLQGSLNYENYSTDLIERVQVNHSEDDVGVIYPAESEGNCFTISENMILGMLESAVVTEVATDLYNQLKSITYVPFSVTVPKSIKIRAGDKISLVDSNGKTFTSYVMKVSITGGGANISSTGDKSYGSNAAVASEQYSNLTGKILSIKKSIDGLVIENKDLAGKVGSLELSTEEFKTFISDNYVSEEELGEYKTEVSTQFTQTAEDFEMRFTETKQDIDAVAGDLEGVETERKSYIRFEDGNIYLGKSDSEIMLIIENDRISFVQNVTGYPELAYISNNILYITEGEFLTQLRIGKFGFTPGVNGNLSFKKVVD
jgi:hypothetical protein